MSYAVLHIAKSGGSCNAIAKHIERKTSPDNAHPELEHLNRDDFIKYPDGVDNLADAVQYRLDHAGLSRKVGKNQVLALHVLLTSDGEALKRISDEGHLDEWAETSIQWAKDTFGEDNVVGAHLHMDEATPHLHVTVVPIVTTERKKKASESNAKKRYRTKPKDGPRLSANDIMTRENLTHFQDTYAEAMTCFGLERGVRGSEARHVDQHEYYRQCQIEKKGLEQDVAKLATEKKKLGREKKTLEKDKSDLEHKKAVLELGCEALGKRKTEIVAEGKDAERRRDSIIRETESLASENRELKKDTQDWRNTVLFMKETVDDLMNEGNRMLQAKHNAASETSDDLRLIKVYFPEVCDMLPAIRECEDVKLPVNAIKVLLDKKEHRANRLSLYYPVQKENLDAGGETLQIKRDPSSDNKFHLHVGGIRVFQWLKQKWESLKQVVKRGIRM